MSFYPRARLPVLVDREAAGAGRVPVGDQVEAMPVDGAGGQRADGHVRKPRAGRTDDRPLRPGPFLSGQHLAQGFPRKSGLMPERTQALSPRLRRRLMLMPPDNIPQRRPRGVGAHRGRPVAQHAGEQLSLTDAAGKTTKATKPISSPLRQHSELFQRLGLIPAQTKHMPAPVVGDVVEAGQPEAAPVFVTDQVAGLYAPVTGMHGMLVWVDGGRPGQRHRAVRADLHLPPGGAVRLARSGHPGASGLLGRTIRGHSVVHLRRRKPTLPRAG
jgi:hypothetical protein